MAVVFKRKVFSSMNSHIMLWSINAKFEHIQLPLCRYSWPPEKPYLSCIALISHSNSMCDWMNEHDYYLKCIELVYCGFSPQWYHEILFCVRFNLIPAIVAFQRDIMENSNTRIINISFFSFPRNYAFSCALRKLVF